MLRARLAFVAAVLSAAIPALASITGNVMDREGKPIPGARLSIYAAESTSDKRTRLTSKTPERAPLTTVTADAKGAFTIPSPKEAVVDLQADAKGYGLEVTRVERDDEGLVVMLSPAPMKQGTITAGGKPVAGATVIWLGSGSELLATTDAAGHYNVPDPAKWANRVLVMHPEYAITLGFFGGPMKSDVNQKLEPGVAITGKVVAADGTTPVAGATVYADNLPLAKTADDGSYSIAHLNKKWETIEAKLGDRVGVRANNSKSAAMKLGASGSISGVVRDSKTQQPVALAEVRLAHAQTFRFGPDINTVSVFTDAKGAFSFTGLNPAAYEISATRPGYSIPSSQLALTASQRGQKSLAATPQARLSGSVVDEDKRPVAGAIVMANSASSGMGGMFMNSFESRRGAVSGPDGRFVVKTQREGDVVVEAQKKGYPSAKTSSFRIAPGERKSGLVLTIPRGIAVTGRVTDGNGKPLSGVTVNASAAEQGPMGGMRRMMVNFAFNNDDDSIQTASDGTFTIRVKEGMYDVAFRREGFAPKTVRGEQVNASVKPLEVTLDPGVEISGIVTRGGTPIADVFVGTVGGSDKQAFTTTGPDGRFTLPDLAPGSYMVTVNKQEDFVQQIKNLTAPARDVAIELPPGGRVTGHVVDKSTHQPVTTFQAGVSMSRSGGGMMMMAPPMMKSFTTDDGSFTLENVPAGNMQIVANAAGYTSGRVPSVMIEEGKTTANIEVALETGVKLTGRVTGPDGAPLSGVSVRADNGRQMMFMNDGSGAATDTNGEYTIDSLEPGDKSFIFSRNGYLEETKQVTLSGRETRLDAQLSAGIRITGVVVTDAGAPVADASVRANSAVSGVFGRSTRTDAAGAFQLEGVAPGHYNFTASKEGFADAIERDVQISEGSQVRLALKTGGIVTGHVSGLSEADYAAVTINIRSTNGGMTGAPLDQSGNFRAEGAPTGTLRISADWMRGFTERRTTEVKTVELAPGGSVQVDLEFNMQTVIKGHISRNGSPLANASVMFMPHQGSTVSTNARAVADDKGYYTISGLSDGMYNVTVVEQRLNPYTTTYEVHGSGNYDIDIKSSTLRGRVLDSASGDPLADATVQLRAKNASDSTSFFSQRTANTDANGVFVIEAVASGSYSAIADKEGYGSGKNDVYVTDGNAPPDIELRLSKNDGVLVKVVDARDGRVLSAQMVVFDNSGQIVFDTPMMMGGSAQSTRVPIPPGQYQAVIAAGGYAAQTVTLTSPSNPSIGLTPGGTLIVHSSSSGLQRARLVSPGGIYRRPFNRDGVFGISGASSQVGNVQPGTYKLEVFGANGAVAKSVDVSIVEGQVTNVDV